VCGRCCEACCSDEGFVCHSVEKLPGINEAETYFSDFGTLGKGSKKSCGFLAFGFGFGCLGQRSATEPSSFGVVSAACSRPTWTAHHQEQKTTPDDHHQAGMNPLQV